ncbi:aspartate racemase [Acetoanaerobium noterae]|uniref:Aspartate racemase n=1 Tax=Acetoanaerobium noterae TaxID=745369 RepID=A0A1T5CXS3_9FIRM|nr:aspartate/glutamate racemase family protein [Acetoanaerobium noterae]SKB64262.1 aspartate racemase [Acetoanaerobium noterae]
MKTIGLIGGMSWESSLEYYRIVNETVKEKLGGLHSCKCLMYSVDFGVIQALQHQNKWDELTKLMIEAAQNLKHGGADFIVICTNTMHKMAPEIEHATGLNVLHIADVTGAAISKDQIQKVGLLGTRFTMEGDFYKKRLKDNYDIEVIIPEDADRQIIHDIIYNELCLGLIKDDSRQKYIDIINKLCANGAEGIILGCTEIPLLIKQSDVLIPVYDTTKIHAESAVDFAL